MPDIRLKYGKTDFSFVYDEDRFTVLGAEKQEKSLTDIEIGEAFDQPIDSPTIEEIVQPDETVLIVVPDATRQVAAGQIVNLLVRRLIANGTLPFEITCIFANGIHRPVTESEKVEILTPFIAQRIKTLNHSARDLMALTKIGEMKNGTPVEINRAVLEHNHVILVGGVSFHYFAGFGGGRKMICPGLASSRTISETHKLAFDCEKKARREGVATGILNGNAVHEAFMEIVEKVNPVFSINTIVTEQGEARKVFAGNWKTAHRAACDYYAAENTIEIEEKRDVVIVSCGGAPYDTNLIQAHKALEAASEACKDGGTIIFLAECADGLGRSDFLKWFEAENSQKLADKLCESYQVNGQTAWSLMRKNEKFDVQIITSLPEKETRTMRFKAADFSRAIAEIPANAGGYILPFGAKFLLKQN